MIKTYVTIILLSVCGGQLIIFGFTNGTTFLILSLLFIAIFVFTTVFTSRKIFQNKHQLLTLIITFVLMGIFQFFFVDNSLRWNRWDLYFILLIILIALGLLIRLALKHVNTTIKSEET